ncbi:uncharacterized protein LOC124159158 [Ischnura elegans]|uniref:uncharacterized protein LOC124159158 n=1 Tax=Ischnura elegans TaxID=197161 RepID=UPI001ED867D3|nr:uncharacterized protein LOC124159158 [Ischnura elegans]
MEGDLHDPLAEVTPPGLQRLWARRMTPCLEESSNLLTELFPPAQDEAPLKNSGRTSPCHPDDCLYLSDHEQDDLKFNRRKSTNDGGHLSAIPDLEVFKSLSEEVSTVLRLDAGSLGDFPACYEIPASWVRRNEFPVVGLYVDPRIVPGFRYRVRSLVGPVPADCNADAKGLNYLFGGRALTLLSIGNGYCHRFTFEADTNRLNSNGNYFWSDSHPNGFAFELVVVSPGDKFTVHDANHLAMGTLEVVRMEMPQMETGQRLSAETTDGEKRGTEKTIRLRMQCKFECFETGSTAQVVTVSGMAIVRKSPGSKAAKIIRIVNVAVGQKRGFTLTPGVDDKKWRRTKVSGEKIGDIPTKYTVFGLEAHELPVIGTYVDPRITPGFHYRVRPAGNPRPLFGGRSLRLLSIGAGYGKRISFEPDSLNNPSAFTFWSDSQPDGFGFEPRAVFTGMRFAVCAGGQRLGEAVVFRADSPQVEDNDALAMSSVSALLNIPKEGVVKCIRVDVTCHVQLFGFQDTQAMRVSGHAIVQKKAGTRVAELLRIENVGLDSQLNLLFVNQQTDVVFCPIKKCTHSIVE